MEAAVAAPEQLITAAHREEGSPARRSLLQRLRLRGEVARDEELLAILAASEVVQVVRARNDRVVHSDFRDVELVPTPGRARGKHGDVAAVGVDVQVVGIQMGDADVHAARSQ